MCQILTLASAAFILALHSLGVDGGLKEWRNNIIYHVYPRSFKDSNGDGIGDLPGITSKLKHVKDAGADTLYLSPIYPSPMKDFGYDISNFTDISDEYGSLDDFDKLVDRARELGLKILLDFVPNHTSDEHEWFKKSIDRIAPYDDYYVWRDAKNGSNGEKLPPNNWLSHFGDSAWEWNEKRQQYYYHAFVAGQPDLNYRNPQVKQEMDEVLLFWLRKGVDGFRVDAPNFLFEDAELRDEPKSDLLVPATDYWSLYHIYTRSLNESHPIIASWRNLLDDYSSESHTNTKYLILEAWSPMDHTMGYYNVGADPFNFMLLFNVSRNSTPSEFKKVISTWLNAIPDGEVTNWIIGNHDNHRVASKYSKIDERTNQMTMLAMILPGIVMVYYGDEIGMLDRKFTYEEGVDPYGCQAGRERFHLYERDSSRTPFQWDESTSAGFSNNTKTWLPVNENYKTLNLALQKKAENSHYKIFQALTSLKRFSPVLKSGTTEILATDDVLGIVRRLEGHRPITLLINFSDSLTKIDAQSWLNIPEGVVVYTASLGSGLEKGTTLNSSELDLKGAVSVLLM
ncbi:hypothetical protein QAD02_017904 [Eretmocerus hayati]|uniref:Uncharacterized protein n=1 Tax=Eretmocerus hayati TaxID=131215 RepID=A0ACC2PF69_9HYME|nr:hypothetical protein QAD02_017904 [Eretmocerus hayati]